MEAKRMTYKNLMKKLDDGRAEVVAWAGDYADVRFFDTKGNERREHVEVTSIPTDVR